MSRDWLRTVADWADAAEAQGWRVERSKRGVKFWPVDRTQRPIDVHLTVSDKRSSLNYRARLRRAGLRI